MDVSLIICTRNRCQQLEGCLGSVRRIMFNRAWELILVDNGSTDETAAVVSEYIKTSDVRTTYLFESASGKSNALNASLEIAKGQILAFTDDDCYVASDFLTRVWSAFGDPSVGYIAGRIMLHDPADHPLTINESVTPTIFPARSFVCAGSVQGANMAFRRKVLVDIGGFDPLFGPGASFPAAEEIEAVSRASGMGWKGEYHPEVVVRHHHQRKAADAAGLWKCYAIGIGAFHMKLLMKSRQFLWFLRVVYQARWRYRTSRTFFFWELVGATRYVCICLSQALGSRLGNQSGVLVSRRASATRRRAG